MSLGQHASRVCTVFAITLSAALAPSALAQDQFMMPDRTTHAVFRLRDLNHDGVITNTTAEVFTFFSAANSPGTLGPSNPSCQAVSNCHLVAVGDQGNACVYLLHDLNGDGDAQDRGESIVFAGAGNGSGVSLAFPTGAAFDSQCRLYITNAGNSFGNDGIYRLVDGNADGDAQDAGEITPYVTDPFFGAGNGPYSPQEIFFDANDVLYLHDSSGTFHGVYRFEDINHNGRADDQNIDGQGTNESTPYFTAANASGVTISAGFTLEPDRARAGSMYMLQTATGAVDQIYRLSDLNNDHDANDAGEALLVYSNAASGFTSVDLLSLPNGDVLITDNSGITVARLHDGNADGDFLDAGESTNMVGGTGTLVQARQIDLYPRPGDLAVNGSVDVNDLLMVIAQWGPSGSCTPADTDCNGTVDVNDLLVVVSNWG